jgi:hypothetical protein
MTCDSLKNQPAQTGATGANRAVASCAAPLPYRGADNWRTDAGPAATGVAQKASRYEIDFGEPPVAGSAYVFDGVTMTVAATEDFTRRSDGKASTLIVWDGSCTVCQAAFTVKTGLRMKTITKRCASHRARGVPATAQAAMRMRNWRGSHAVR